MQPRGRGSMRGTPGSGPPGGGAGRGRGSGPPARGRGGVPRTGPPSLVGGPGGQGTPSAGLPSAHVQTVGVKRPGWGRSGRGFTVLANMFRFSASPDSIIYHYDIVITANRQNKPFPSKFNLEIIKHLQELTAPTVFTPKAVYDGRKNMFASRKLALGPNDTREFDVSFGSAGGNVAPIIYTVRVTKVAEISTEVLDRYLHGEHAQDNEVLTAIMALNVVIRMDPISKYPFNVRSFFHHDEHQDLGFGLEAWRGYFQSVRPSPGRLLLNIDIASAVLYKPGPLIQLCLDFLKQNNPAVLGSGMDGRVRLKLERHIKGMRISTGDPGQPQRKYTVQGLSVVGADGLNFKKGNQTITVAKYFLEGNRRLRFPGILCAKVSSTAFIPLERCTVLPGQIVRKDVPEDAMRELLTFSTKKPADRLGSIRNGVRLLDYGQSDYIRQFGIGIDTTAPMRVPARILEPPVLKYGDGSRPPNITPRNGSWNMADKKLIKPMTIRVWVVIIFESQSRFRPEQVETMVKDFMNNCKPVGMSVLNPPLVKYANPQGKIGDIMKDAGRECLTGPLKKAPDFIMAVLPDFHNGDIYKAIKFHGDTVLGVATQCLKVGNCRKAKAQYWANVLLKVNPKLAGLNWEHASLEALADPRTPTMIMGADVVHPGPGNTTSPSFAALVASVDSKATHYVAEDRVQTARQEIIADLRSMCKAVIQMFMDYQKNMEKKTAQTSQPKRIVFFRDGVSEGQFQQVLDFELPMLKGALDDLNIKATITFIIVGKRHHIRLFPEHGPEDRNADRSGNCPAGTVVDQEITHPLEFDFYLQSHGGLLGTSRSAHYSVLYDDNHFTPDAIQSLSFALCHVFARATRSVSIPAPVYYADIVCGRAKSRFDPQSNIDFSDAGSTTGTNTTEKLEGFTNAFKPLHAIHKRRMYFL